MLASEVIYDVPGGTLTFNATVNGAIPAFGTAGLPDTNGFYVWGINRGGGTERFVGGTPSVGGGVAFDSVVIVNRNGSGAVNDLLAPATPTPLGAGTALISGNTVSLTLPVGLFPPEAPGNFLPEDFLWNLWPRWAGGNAGITDFAPNDIPGSTDPNAANAAVTVVPEPGSLAAIGIGLAALFAAARRRRA